MKAVLCTRYGTPADLALSDIDAPQPGRGEALVEVKAVGLNFFDTLLIAGKYQIKPAFPFSPGAEFAGVIASVGPNPAGLRPGDRVLGWMGHGAARERVTVPVEALIRVPEQLSFERAAGLSVTYGTTLHALKDRAETKAGESVAVLGASGGVGIAAVEIAKRMGARVIACASSEAKLAFARRHGADETVDYGREGLRDALRRLTGGQGVDVVYDPVGGSYSEAALRALQWGGRLLVIGFAAGEIPKLPLNLVLLKGCDIRGVFWGEWARREPARHRENMEQIVRWAAGGKISAPIHATYPLEQTAAALEAIARREVMGKVVLTV